MKTQIDILVGEYLATHPFFEYPQTGDRHPSVLAIGGQINPWLLKVLGGPTEYWLAMLASAKVWFDHDGAEHSMEFRLFAIALRQQAMCPGMARRNMKHWRTSTSNGVDPKTLGMEAAIWFKLPSER